MLPGAQTQSNGAPVPRENGTSYGSIWASSRAGDSDARSEWELWPSGAQHGAAFPFPREAQPALFQVTQMRKVRTGRRMEWLHCYLFLSLSRLISRRCISDRERHRRSGRDRSRATGTGGALAPPGGVRGPRRTRPAAPPRCPNRGRGGVFWKDNVASLCHSRVFANNLQIIKTIP